MKKIAFYLKKRNVLLLALFVSLITFTACEKVDENADRISDNNTSISSKTEMIVVGNEQWIEKDGKIEVYLNSVFLNGDDDYNYVMVYSKVVDESKNDRNYEWEEMPNSEYTFSIVDYNIIVQKNDTQKERATFLVEVKFKK